MNVRLEHANLSVRDIEAMIRFLTTAFPEFRVRGEGKSRDGSRWVHLGTDDTYLNLSQATTGFTRHWIPYSGEPGVNHLAYEVDDVEAVRTRLMTAGFRDSTPPNAHPHRRRVYFYDPEGNDWEFVQYYTQDPAERNDYDLPDL
jgi:catechol 2,3-dioxygenase-like lactoylglutathione lyase family enzyme